MNTRLYMVGLLMSVLMGCSAGSEPQTQPVADAGADADYVPKCAPGATQCHQEKTQEGMWVVQACDNDGGWFTAQKCGYICQYGDTCVGDCRPGGTSCKEHQLFKCDDSAHWVNIGGC